MGSESTPKASSKRFYIETRRRHTTTSWSVKNYNKPLSALEIGSIHASVECATRDLKKLEHDLKSAKKTVQALTKAHKSMAAFIAAERALLSPIRAIPPELLSNIFVHHASAFTTHGGYIVAALTVSQVCQGWRTVAHATAVLWTRFTLYYGSSHRNIIPERQMVLYRAWHARSGALSCDVELRKASSAMENRIGRDEDEDEEPDVVLNRDLYYYDSSRYLWKERWRHLDIECNSNASFRLQDIESVQSLTIHFVEAENWKSRHRLVEQGSQLEDLVLRCSSDSSINRPVFLPLLPLKKVKRCEMSSFPLTNGLQILQEAKSLETLKWTTAFCGEETEDTMPKVTTNLHTLDLSIWDISESYLSPLFNNLTAPELRTLHIKWMYRSFEDEEVSAYWDSANFITFLTRSAASLTSLSLLHANISESQLIALLEHTPLLVQLSLSDRYALRHDGIVQMLGPLLLRRLLPPAPSEFATPLVPKLEVLRLRGGFDGNDMCDADILRVFEARYPPVPEERTEYARLTKGAFHLMRPADQQLGGKVSLAERAARLVARGLDFEFTTLEPDPDDPADVETDSEGGSSS
ncbi:hypothetical protein B0H13DRAFT_2266704 [Mycena leptocephala]|nr:hypothetical protein B0H13DRAFT_2266704 [Mycena leptocephala]